MIDESCPICGDPLKEGRTYYGTDEWCLNCSYSLTNGNYGTDYIIGGQRYHIGEWNVEEEVKRVWKAIREARNENQ